VFEINKVLNRKGFETYDADELQTELDAESPFSKSFGVAQLVFQQYGGASSPDKRAVVIRTGFFMFRKSYDKQFDKYQDCDETILPKRAIK